MSWWDGDPGTKEMKDYSKRKLAAYEAYDAERTRIYEERHPGKTRKRLYLAHEGEYPYNGDNLHLNAFEDRMEDELWDLRQIVATKATSAEITALIQLIQKLIDHYNANSNEQKRLIEELRQEVADWKEMAVGRKEPEQGKNTSDKGNLRLVSR